MRCSNNERHSDRSRNSNAVRTAVIETMESRRMFAVTATLSGGEVKIVGTGASDNIEVYKNGSKLDVRVGGAFFKNFNYASVNKVKAELKGGNDRFTSNNSTNKPMQVYGSTGNDTVTTGAGHDKLYGSDGNDSLTGGWGNDSLYGGANADTFRGGIGDDSCYGGSGADFLYDESGKDRYFGDDDNDYLFADTVNITDADQFWGGSGTDYLSYYGRSNSVRIATDDVANDGFTNGSHGPGVELDNVHSDIENFSATDQADGIYLSGNHNNVVFGNGGGDYIMGGPGSDTLYGGDGNDWIFGEAGQDSMYGGNGNDTLYANASDWSDLCNGGAGTDTAIVDLHYGVSAETHVSIEIWHG